MYKQSIKNNSKFLIPFIEGIKYYKSDDIEHNLGSMMIINDEGDILTCRHIAERFIINDKLKISYKEILANLSNNKDRKKIENKYNLKENTVVLTNITFPFPIKENIKIEIKLHKYLDIALISIKNCDIKAETYPTFSKKLPEIGQSICKLGFAFPEYNYYEYSHEKNNIILKKDMKSNFPLFPLDGIVTRHIMDEHGELSYFETSSPGIRGQSGGPIFSPEGLIYGMQSMTKHLDLNFDITTEVKRNNIKKSVTHTPFINLGVGVSSVEIIKFLDENKIKYNSK